MSNILLVLIIIGCVILPIFALMFLLVYLAEVKEKLSIFLHSGVGHVVIALMFLLLITAVILMSTYNSFLNF